VFTRLKQDIQCVFERDPAARTTFEVLTTYPGVHAVVLHRFSHWLWLHNLRWLGRMVSSFSRLMTGIEIHPGAKIGKRFFIDHGMGVVIGETAEVHEDVTLYHGVTLGGTSWNKGKRHPTLLKGVVVGAGAKILGPVTIGESARVGSNAVITTDVPAHSTAVGVPGRIIVAEDIAAQRRHAIAQKMGFDAYGLTENMSDPIAKSLNAILDHMHKMEIKVESMCGALDMLGIDSCSQDLPELDYDELALDDDGQKPES